MTDAMSAAGVIPVREDPTETSAAPGAGNLGGHRWLTLGLMTFALMISFADRSALSMLVQPIKAELGLSDAGIGMLTGFAFAAFYAVFGLLLAQFADRGHSRRIIIGSLVVWSIMTALCGAARNFWELLVARFGVGAGEAGAVPAAQAIITRLFPPERRSTALAVLMAGGPVGMFAAFALTGRIEALVGWRATFLLFGLPGLLLAVIILLVSRRTPAEELTPLTGAMRPARMTGVMALLSGTAFRQVLLAAVALNFLTFGQTQWLPAYVERSFGLARADVGPLLALTQGIGLLLGTMMGGPIYDWLGKRDERWRPRLLLGGALIGAPIVIGVYVVDGAMPATILAAGAAFVFALPSGHIWATVHSAVPLERRATGAAVVMMAGAFVGMGMGPVVIGALSDALAGWAGAQSLRYALLVLVSMGGAWFITHVLLLNRATAVGGPSA